MIGYTSKISQLLSLANSPGIMKVFVEKNRNYSLYFSVILFLISNPIYSQLDSLLFYKEFHGDNIRNILGVDDQNSDGCNDILIYDCKELTLSLYYGGSPMDTIPDLELEIPGLFLTLDMETIDLNNDNYKDIVVSALDSSWTFHVNVFYGGALLDNQRDLVFNGPEGSKQYAGIMHVMKDFNGDGKEELVIYDTNPPFEPEQFGIFYIYNIGAIFDTTEYKTIAFPVSDSLSIFEFQTGDLNGDGLADISLLYSHRFPYVEYRSFIAGNPAWNFEPITVFNDAINTFDCAYQRILKDLNGDNQDDIMIRTYGEEYPYFYYNSLLYGDIPLDTVIDVGLNTQNLAIMTNRTISPGDINGDGYNDMLL